MTDTTPTSAGSGGRELRLTVDGREVVVADESATLLQVLRDEVGVRSVKDGCSPQGQCGCCTVLVDGQPRVSCVTPVRRVAGRAVTTADGLDPEVAGRWADALCATGGSQCGFCTPGIVVRLAGLEAKGPVADRGPVERALAAHLCRCTGWQTILDAWDVATGEVGDAGAGVTGARDLEAASRRATIEGRADQRVGPQVALGRAGFADDLAPLEALVAVPDGSGGWAVGESVAEARRNAGKVQGRRTTVDAAPPLELPDGDWDATLRTCWVEPGYLETDASWCEPGGEPASALANGGAFGAKSPDSLAAVARTLADEHGRAVRVLWAREDVVRLGPKRPPVAGGARADGTGVIVVARTPGIAEAIASIAPGLEVREVDLAGPPTSASVRAAGWAEAAVLLAGAKAEPGPVTVSAPGGGTATAEVVDGAIRVSVCGGEVLDEVAMASYAVGAAHMAYGWVTSEGLAVESDGTVGDLTIRSFGIVKASGTPRIEVDVIAGDGPAVNTSDAAFAAVAAAVWLHQGCPTDWPTRGALR